MKKLHTINIILEIIAFLVLLISLYFKIDWILILSAVAIAICVIISIVMSKKVDK